MALALLLCAPWVRKAMKWAVEPQPTWFLRRNDQQHPAPAAAMSGSSPSEESNTSEGPKASEGPAAPGAGGDQGGAPATGDGNGSEPRPGSS